MYTVSPAVSAAWRTLFEWVASEAGAAMRVIDHAYPAPLDALWAREDMGCVFMCGLPYAARSHRPRVIAAPLPSPARYGGRPVYFTDFVVRAGSPYRTLEDTFGSRFAYTIETSHSGYNAARYSLLAHRTPSRPRLYAEVVGPLITPRHILQALLDDLADVAPLDSYALDLMRRHTPDLIHAIRVVASTVAAPIAPLVASPGIPAETCTGLMSALLAAHRAPELSGVLHTLLLSGFSAVTPADYAVLMERARAAEEADYSRIA